MSSETIITCDLCGRQLDSDDISYDLWLDLSGIDKYSTIPNKKYDDIYLDVCDDCEPEFRKELDILIKIFKKDF